MIDATKLNINQLPKKFVDGAIGNHTKAIFYLVFTSGNNLDSFALVPQTMKSIASLMNDQIQKYEKAFGKIDMNPPAIISPLQASDLDKPGDKKN